LDFILNLLLENPSGEICSVYFRMRSLHAVAAASLAFSVSGVDVLDEHIFTDDALSLLQVAKSTHGLPSAVERPGDDFQAWSGESWFLEESADVDDNDLGFPYLAPGTLYECGEDSEHILEGDQNTEATAAALCLNLPSCVGIVNEGVPEESSQWYLMTYDTPDKHTWVLGDNRKNSAILRLSVQVKVTRDAPRYMDASIPDVSPSNAPVFESEGGAIFACEHHPRCRGFWVDPDCNFQLLLHTTGPPNGKPLEWVAGFPGAKVKTVRRKGLPGDDLSAGAPVAECRR
jgi:hypothetical protein